VLKNILVGGQNRQSQGQYFRRTFVPARFVELDVIVLGHCRCYRRLLSESDGRLKLLAVSTKVDIQINLCKLDARPSATWYSHRVFEFKTVIRFMTPQCHSALGGLKVLHWGHTTRFHRLAAVLARHIVLRSVRASTVVMGNRYLLYVSINIDHGPRLAQANNDNQCKGISNSASAHLISTPQPD
jgi:hypothetical protein